MSQADRYTLIARIASTENPHTDAYPIKWDTATERLTCPCPKWKFCRGNKTCHHVEAAAAHLRAAKLTVHEAMAIMATASGTTEFLPQRQIDPIEQLWNDLIVNPAQDRRGSLQYVRSVRLSYEQFRDRVLALGATVPVPSSITSSRPDWLGGIRAIILRD